MHTEEEQGARTPDAAVDSVSQYAAAASQYDESFRLTFRTEVEQPSVLQAIGAVQGLRVLDVACGTGHYTRLLRRAGAAHVVGVDLSPDMIAVAQQAEAQEPLGITYLVRDATELEPLGQPFDLVVAVYLLHYATSPQHLQQMCQRIVRNLRPGGRFVACLFNPDLCVRPGYYRKYGIEVFISGALQDGTQYGFSFATGNGWLPPISVYYCSWDAIERAFQQAGFGAVRRINLDVSVQGIEEHAPGFWDDYLSAPDSIILAAELAT